MYKRFNIAPTLQPDGSVEVAVPADTQPVLERRPLCGQSVLVVEDEAFIALDLEWVLTAAGAKVTVTNSLQEGFAALAEPGGWHFDLALLDIRLGDGEVYPLADALFERVIPLVFYSGHGDANTLRAAYPGSLTVRKPSSDHILIAALAKVSQTGRGLSAAVI